MAELSLQALWEMLPKPPKGANFGTTSSLEDAEMPLSGLDEAVAGIGKGIAHTVATPGRLMAPNPWPAGSEGWYDYERSKQNAAMNWAPETALNTIGTGMPFAKAGAAGVGGGKLLQPEGIKAYHSSPHDFDRFDLSKIGTGEGAQVYGHGIYAAENPAVSGQGGQYWNQFLPRFSGPEGMAARTLGIKKFDRDAAIEAINKGIERQAGVGSPPEARWMQDAIQARKLLESGAPVGPRTYELNIRADPQQMLDWDKPLREQQHLLDPLQSAGVSRRLLNEASGGDLYHKAAIDFHRPGLGHLDRAFASEKFAEAGIPGIKYLDQGSRNAQPILKTSPSGEILSSHYPPPSSNYVIFDPANIDILKKYGLAGLAPLAGAGALQQQPRQEVY